MPTDFTNYYQKVIANPTATPEAKAEARTKLGLPSSDLTGTMTQERTLPQTSQGNLSVFGSLIKMVSEKAGQEAKASGMLATGVDPSSVSGGTLGGIVDYINKQKTTGIEDIYKTTTKFLLDTQNNAKDQLKTLIDSGAIANITDQALSKLASTSGIDYDTLVSIKKSKKTEATQPKSFDTITRNGKQIRVGFDKYGNIISETDLNSDAGGGKQTETERKRDIVKGIFSAIKGVKKDKNGKVVGNALNSNDKILPEDYKKLKEAWTSEGYGGKEFDDFFSIYIDKNLGKYDITI